MYFEDDSDAPVENDAELVVLLWRGRLKTDTSGFFFQRMASSAAILTQWEGAPHVTVTAVSTIYLIFCYIH